MTKIRSFRLASKYFFTLLIVHNYEVFWVSTHPEFSHCRVGKVDHRLR